MSQTEKAKLIRVPTDLLLSDFNVSMLLRCSLSCTWFSAYCSPSEVVKRRMGSPYLLSSHDTVPSSTLRGQVCPRSSFEIVCGLLEAATLLLSSVEYSSGCFMPSVQPTTPNVSIIVAHIRKRVLRLCLSRFMIIRRSFILEYWVFLRRRRFLALAGQSHISVLKVGRNFDRACGRGVGDYAVSCPLWGRFRADDCGIIR